jgi:phenylalanyl-tRNA synthetase alpha chain
MAQILDAAELNSLLNEARAADVATGEALESFRIAYFGRQGVLKSLNERFREVPREQKREMGQALNAFKDALQSLFDEASSAVVAGQDAQTSGQDPTLPSGALPVGSHHPLSLVRREILDIFARMGFVVADGPEIEDDWHVFSGLNFPEEHPARDMQDTFFVQRDPDLLLRTHTSSVQVREMERRDPPFRLVMPGRVFRNEAISARAHCIFHQVEGLYIDKGVGFADMKQTLLMFARQLFGADVKIRLRPSYFPFTEPSAEMDVYWGLKTEVDKRITKGTGWLEIMGCGMVDPAVLEASGIDPEAYSGFAFGMGIERIAMLKWQIGDLRLFFENDMRFTSQFTGG